MSRGRAGAWAGMAALSGAAVLIYLLTTVPPYLPDGQTNSPALILFLVGLLLFVGGLGSLIALALHKQWPALAGARSRRAKPSAGVALRQGTLLAVTVAVMVVLAYTHFLDIAFVFIAVVLAGLVEAVFRSRSAA